MICYILVSLQTFTDQSRVTINVDHGFILTWTVADAAICEGVILRDGLLDKANMARTVSDGTIYHSAAKEACMVDDGIVSRVQYMRSRGAPDAGAHPVGEQRPSKICSRVQYVVAD